MRIKTAMRKSFEKLFGLFGRKVFFAPKDNTFDMVLIDRNMLSAFLNQDKRIRLYYEGLKRTGLEWSDNFSKQCRFYSLQEMVAHTIGKKLEGEFAECGCWKGHSTYIIAKILSENHYKNSFHIFDSFEGGLSEKVREDENERFRLTAKQIQTEKRIFSSTQEEVRSVLSEFAFVKLYKGWIPERFPEVESLKFSFVHIDVDLYQPVLDSLNFFYPRLLAGGCIVLDDYGFSQFPGCKKAVDLFLSQNRFSLFYEIPVGGCFIIK